MKPVNLGKYLENSKQKSFEKIPELKKLRVIGEGPYSIIFEAIDWQTYRKYALKEIDLRTVSQTGKRNVHNEIRIHRGLIHSNIVKLVESVITTDKVTLVLELCERGNLFRKMRKSVLNLQQRKYVFSQVVSGLKFLHSSSILWRDLKPENILLTHDHKIKLCDFGWAVDAFNADKGDEPAGTLLYMSPESLRGVRQEKSSDLWSLGVLLYEMAENKEPFKGTNFREMLDEIEDKKVIAFSANIDSEERVLVEQLLVTSAQKRPTLQQIEESNYFQSGILLTGKVFGDEMDKSETVKLSKESRVNGNLVFEKRVKNTPLFNFGGLAFAGKTAFLKKPQTTSKNKQLFLETKLKKPSVFSRQSDGHNFFCRVDKKLVSSSEYTVVEGLSKALNEFRQKKYKVEVKTPGGFQLSFHKHSDSNNKNHNSQTSIHALTNYDETVGRISSFSKLNFGGTMNKTRNSESRNTGIINTNVGSSKIRYLGKGRQLSRRFSTGKKRNFNKFYGSKNSQDYNLDKSIKQFRSKMQIIKKYSSSFNGKTQFNQICTNFLQKNPEKAKLEKHYPGNTNQSIFTKVSNKNSIVSGKPTQKLFSGFSKKKTSQTLKFKGNSGGSELFKSSKHNKSAKVDSLLIDIQDFAAKELTHNSERAIKTAKSNKSNIVYEI